MNEWLSSIRWDDGSRMHLSRRGALYVDDRGGQRRRIGSFCIDDPEQGPVVVLPIMPIGENR